MRSCPSENRLLDLIDGQAAGRRMDVIIAHLAQCATCRSITASLAVMAPPDARSGGASAAEPAPAEGPEPAPAALQVGRRVGAYLLVRRLGSGGMGVVFEAVHERIGGRAAIKILHPRHACDPAAVERFRNEARATNLVEHPGLVHIFELGRLPGGEAFIAMEHLAGESLGQRLARVERLSTEAAVALGLQVADALAAAHDKGVIHRDLKPENIMLVPDPVAPPGERAKILDFGLAKLVADPDRAGRSALTQSGALLGTPLYMAPEQCQGVGQVDGRADVYALGVVLFHALAGRPPFVARSPGEVLAMHLRDPPPPLQAEVPPALAALIGSLLTKDPAARPSMREVRAQLGSSALLDPRAARSGRGPARPGRRGGLLLASGGALLAIGAGALFWKARATTRPGEAAAAVAQIRGQEPALPPPRAATPSPLRPAHRVYIPTGIVRMGSTRDEIDRATRWCREVPGDRCDQFARELPQREVSVSAFMIDQDEVTNERFAAWLDARPSVTVRDAFVYDGALLLADIAPPEREGGIVHSEGRFTAQPGFERRPVRWVTWSGALAYCADQGMRLPTEAEWEHAARGLRQARFPWGDDEPRCDGVVFARKPGRSCERLRGGPEDVGTSRQDRSAQGVNDLAGNVAEWVMDRHVEHPRSCRRPPCMDPAPDEQDRGGPRAVRGGDWLGPPAYTRAAFRSRMPKEAVRANLGFRCAAPISAAVRPGQ